MRGFTDKALVLGPEPSVCDGKPMAWKMRFTATLNKIVKYCQSNGIDVYYLVTDEMVCKSSVARGNGVLGINTLGRGDMHFLSMYNPVYAHPETIATTDMYKDIVKACMDKVPVPEGDKSEDTRVSVMTKRESKAAKEIIKNFNLIFNIQFKNNAQYKATTKDGDCRAVVKVDATTFNASVQLSGQFLSPIDVLEIGNANLPVFQWEV